MSEIVELGIISSQSGAKLGECEFVDGIAHGMCRIWNEAGVPTLEATMLHGHYYGLYSSFWANGAIKERGEYILGKKVGLYRWVYESGLLMQEHDYGHAT